MINIAVIEDEKASLEQINQVLTRFSQENKEEIKINNFHDGETFLSCLSQKFDVILMDIELPGINGMDTCFKLREIDKEAHIIFTTNMAQYAIRGYKVNAMSYLMKPINYDELEVLLKLIVDEKKVKIQPITLKINNSIKVIDIKDIKYIESYGHEIIYYTINETYTKRGSSIKEIYSNIKDGGFAKINSSTIVNIKFCQEINNEYVLIDNKKLYISRNMKKEFLERLSLFLTK